jgi:Ca2+-binding RTX toxin-like protein
MTDYGLASRSFISATINGGEGDDQISLNFDGSVRVTTAATASSSTIPSGEAYGGAGDDYVWLSGDNVDANVDGGEGDDWIDASSNNFKVFIHGGAGNDTIFGSNYDDHLFGDAGNNVIYGLGGNDSISIRNGSYDCADGGGDVGDICFADSSSEYQDSVSGFGTVFFG